MTVRDDREVRAPQPVLEVDGGDQDDGAPAIVCECKCDAKVEVRVILAEQQLTLCPIEQPKEARDVAGGETGLRLAARQRIGEWPSTQTAARLGRGAAAASGSTTETT